MKKSKRILSILLASVLALSAFALDFSPVSASETAVPDTNAAVLTAPPAVTVSTDPVARVAAAQYSLLRGTALVAATRSGIPDVGGASYASVAYAGETPYWAGVRITFPVGQNPDATPGVVITASTPGGSVAMSAVYKDGQTYSATITGGTATPGNTIKYTITYNVSGMSYTNYGYTYVDNILNPSGIRYSRYARTWYFTAAGRLYFVSRYLGANVYADEATGSATHGYYDIGNNSFVSNPASPNNVMLYGDKDGGTSHNYNVGYVADANRPTSRIYIDRSVNASLSSLNFRVNFFLQSSLNGDSSNVGLTSMFVQSGNVQSVSASDSTSDPTSDSTAYSQLGPIGTSAKMTEPGDSITATFTGPGPTASGTVYTVTTYNQAPGGDYTVGCYSSIKLTAYVYNKGALRTRISQILSGAAGKGINPQSWFYSSGWSDFINAYDNANLILMKPDTDQATIDSTLNQLNGYYDLLIPKTFTYSVNFYKIGTNTKIIPSQTGTGAYSGYTLVAVAEDIPGYLLTPFDSSPAKIVLSSTNKEINFYYSPLSYTLTFVSDPGSPVAPITQDYQTLVAKPADPVLAENTFTGWYYDQARTQLVSWPLSMPLNGKTLYAGWSLTPVMLAFESNYGTAVAPIFAAPGSAVAKPADPARSDYRFDGWFFDQALTQPVTWPLTMPSGGTTVYAKWTYIAYTITFDSKGGTPISPVTADPGTLIYAPAQPTRTGYTFSGWYYDDNTFQNAVSWPVVIPPTGYTVYAKWDANLITLSFNTGGGTVIAPLVAYAGSTITPPPNPTRFGYVFNGWTLNGQPYDVTQMPDVNSTAVAQWVANNKSVQVTMKTYKLINEELVETSTARPGDVITVTLNPQTNFFCGASRFVVMYDTNFYDIVGVNKAAITPYPANTYYAQAISGYSGSTTSPASGWPATFVNGESTAYKYVTANFTASTSSANGGHPVKMNGATPLFSFKLQVKADATGSGRIFMDSRWDRSTTYTTGIQYYFWCANSTMLSSEGNSILDFNTDYTQADVSVAIDTSPPAFSTLYFNTDGGSYIAPIYGQIGAVATPPPNPVKTGYTFAGWSPSFPGVYPASDMVLTALWNVNTYNAKFYVEGSLYATVPTAYGAAVVPPATPLKTGYTFVSWSPELGTMGDGEQIYSAIFTIGVYQARFYVDGELYASISTEYQAAIQPPVNPVKSGYTFNSWSPAVGNMGPGDMTFNAQFTANTYNARFYVDGSLYSTKPTVFGQQIQLPAPPTKSAYIFTGWTPSVGIMGAADIRFDAVWELLTYKADFMVAGQLYASVKTVPGAAIVPPTDPTREGYTFDGWLNIPAAMPDNDIQIDSLWLINSYQAVFKVDGSVYASQTINYGAPVNPPAPPVKTGYTFQGWNPVPTTMPAANTTYNAVYTANIYNASFYVDGVLYQTVPTAYGAAIVLPPNPAKTGYVFQNWASLPPTMPANNVTLNAVFTPGTFNAVFMFGSTVYATVPTVYNTPIDVPADPSKAGFTFTGWDPVPGNMPGTDTVFNAVMVPNKYNAVYMVDGAVYMTIPTDCEKRPELPPHPSKTGYTFEGWLNFPLSMPAHEVLITAVFSVNTYTDTFIVDGEVYDTVNVAYGASIPLPAQPVKENAVFGGWSPSVPPVQTAGDIVFTATWIKSKYDAVFMVEGDEYARVATAPGQPIVEPPAPSRPGYLFLGWDPGLPPEMPNEDLTFTAVWYWLGQYNVSFDLNGGTGAAPAAQLGDAGSPVTLPGSAGFSRQYYNFLGWAESPSATTALTSYNFQSTDVVLYAVWSRVPVTLAKKAGSTTVIASDAGVHYIYGLEEGISEQAFRNNFIKINGDGRIYITKVEGSFGTGTKIELYDNVTNFLVATYWVVIFGDVDGDGYVTAADENLIDAAASYQSEFVYGTAAFYAADIMQDGGVDALDLNLVSAATSYTAELDQANPGALI